MSETIEAIRFRAFFIRFHNDPEDLSLPLGDAERLLTDTNSTGTFRVFDEDAKTTVTILPTSAVIAVAEAGKLTVGDQVQVIQDDNVALIASVDAVDTTAGTITLGTTPSPQLTVGSTVRKIYGTPGSQEVAMTQRAATPVQGSAAWGWQGLGDPDFYSDLVPGVNYRMESIVVKTAGTKVNSVQSVCGTVQADCA